MSAVRPVTLITGASAGIGAELARVFARNGHEVVLVARREQMLAALASEIATSGARPPICLALDLTVPDASARIAQALSAQQCEPEFVVNNAGFGLVGLAAELDRNEQIAMVDLNVRALTDLSLAVLDSLKRRRGGLLNVASVAAFLPGPGMAVYYATKAYVLSFSEALHRELKPDGVRVTVLCPGPVKTEFQARAGIVDEHFPAFLARSAGRVADEGYRALMAGRRLVVPGTENKVVTLLPRILPRGLLLRITDARQKLRRASPAPRS
jgi:short-subunit dehydrogenase